MLLTPCKKDNQCGLENEKQTSFVSYITGWFQTPNVPKVCEPLAFTSARTNNYTGHSRLNSWPCDLPGKHVYLLIHILNPKDGPLGRVLYGMDLELCIWD